MQELCNEDRTVLYSGEAVITSQSGKPVYELNGQGKLETFGYQDRYSVFSGRFVSNQRQGQATLVKKTEKGTLVLEFEGVFKDDVPQG